MSLLPDQYIKFSPVTAEIFLNQSSRIFAVDACFLRTLSTHVTGVWKQDSADVLYRMGYLWGHQAFMYLESLVRTVFPQTPNLRDLSMADFQRLFTEHLSALGWGHFELAKRDDFLFVDLHSSATAEVLPKERPTSCELYAGFFAGIFGRISEMELGCCEITCQHDGYNNCSFLLDTTETLSRLTSLRAKTLSPLDAFRAFQTEVSSS